MLFSLIIQNALVMVAAQLVHRVAYVFGRCTTLALHHHQRDAIDEQHEINGSRGLYPRHGRRALHLELIDHGEGVVGRFIPVDEANYLARDRHPSLPPPLPSGRRAIAG